jgi:predicted enzyme related to lactoylglutathione lyase
MSKHPVVHVEISATNLGAASKFYADLFGWKIEHIPEMNYATFEPGEGVGGGFNPVTEENPAGSVVVYIGTDDIEASLAKAEQLGGKAIVPKTEIPGMGWFGMFLDPIGNKIGLFTATMAQGS